MTGHHYALVVTKPIGVLKDIGASCVEVRHRHMVWRQYYFCFLEILQLLVVVYYWYMCSGQDVARGSGGYGKRGSWEEDKRYG